MASTFHFRNGDRILFQGDSITDCGRRESPDGLGGGYVAMVQGILAARRPDLRVRILNRGISGDRTAELLTRWEEDCVQLKPDVLSIMIGVNDVWRKQGEWNGQKHIPLPQFRRNLVRLVEAAMSSGVRQLVLMSPTTIEKENNGPLNELLAEYDAFVRELAAAQQGIYVPARAAFLRAREQLPDVVWSADGCHPSIAGHALLAHEWLKAVGLV